MQVQAMIEFLKSVHTPAEADEPELVRLSLIEVLEAARTGVLPEAQSASLRAMITARLCGLPDSFYTQIAGAVGCTARAAKVHLAQAAGLALQSVDRPAVAADDAKPGNEPEADSEAEVDAMDMLEIADPEALAEFHRQETMAEQAEAEAELA